MRRSLLALALLAACAGGQSRPASIALGEASCDFCHMTIESERRAAQWVPPSGLARSFDEAGCLMRYVAMASPGDPEGALWVHDEASGEWMDARAALFVLPGSPVPGMMYGVLAFRDRARADEARGEGRIVGFDALLAELRA